MAAREMVRKSVERRFMGFQNSELRWTGAGGCANGQKLEKGEGRRKKTEKLKY
jgi:hypothetical protein